MGLTAVVLSDHVAEGEWWIHGLWCAIGIARATPVLRAPFRFGFGIVLRDHLVMFTSGFVLFFLFGASLLAMGTQKEIARVLELYPIGAPQALYVDGLNAIGFGIAVIAASLSRGRWIEAISEKAAVVVGHVSAGTAVLLFLGMSLAVFVSVNSADFGLTENVPGILRTLARSSLVAIFLGAAYRGRGQQKTFSLTLLITSFEVAAGFLRFSKSSVILPLGAFVAGLSFRYDHRKILPVGLAALVTVYLAIGSVVSYGRGASRNKSTENVIEARKETLSEGVAAARDESSQVEYSPWARLCYTPTQAGAIDLYDQGWGGDNISVIPWLFVPRVLAPEKPIITRSGYEFYEKLTGQEGTSLGQGIFVSGYYDAGWAGLVLASALCGWLLAQTSAIARVALRSRSALMVPYPLAGMYMALRLDGNYLADYLGMFVIILYSLVILGLPVSRGHALPQTS